MRASIALLLWISPAAFAQTGLPADSAPILSPPQTEAHLPSLETVTESEVVLHNQRYRRIVTQNETFYLRLQEADSTQAPLAAPAPNEALREARRDCLRADRPLAEGDAAVSAEARVTQETSLFLEALHDECAGIDPRLESDAFGGLKIALSSRSNLRIGVEASRVSQAEIDPEPVPMGSDGHAPTLKTLAPMLLFTLSF